jgi:hypothetical protein
VGGETALSGPKDGPHLERNGVKSGDCNSHTIILIGWGDTRKGNVGLSGGSIPHCLPASIEKPIRLENMDV